MSRLMSSPKMSSNSSWILALSQMKYSYQWINNENTCPFNTWTSGSWPMSNKANSMAADVVSCPSNIKVSTSCLMSSSVNSFGLEMWWMRSESKKAKRRLHPISETVLSIQFSLFSSNSFSISVFLSLITYFWFKIQFSIILFLKLIFSFSTESVNLCKTDVFCLNWFPDGLRL